MKRKNWYPLDNAGKIFPAVYGETRPYNFCFSAILTENIEVVKLNIAINNILSRTPTFKTKLKRGIFWYYLEENKKPFVAVEEIPNYLGLLDFEQNNDYLFKVYYREKKISIVAFHALSDGNGVLNVFKEILLEYLLLTGKKINSNGLIKTKLAPETYNEIADNYVSNFKKSKIKQPKVKNIAHADGTAFGYDGYGIISASINIDEIKKVANSYNATITEYLSGIYMYVLYNNFVKNKNTKKKNVAILVPLNMRKKYNSQSLRNFSLFIRISHYFDTDLSLKDCINICSKQMKEGATEEALDSINYSNVKIEKNVLLKIVPLFLKDFVMRIGYYFQGENIQSGDLSNVGLVDAPKDFKKYVKDLYFSISASFSAKQNLGVIGYNGKLNLMFTRFYLENNFEKDFISELVNSNLNVVVSSNYWEKKL